MGDFGLFTGVRKAFDKARPSNPLWAHPGQTTASLAEIEHLSAASTTSLEPDNSNILINPPAGAASPVLHSVCHAFVWAMFGWTSVQVIHPHQRCGYSDSPFARIHYFHTAGSRKGLAVVGT